MTIVCSKIEGIRENWSWPVFKLIFQNMFMRLRKPMKITAKTACLLAHNRNPNPWIRSRGPDRQNWTEFSYESRSVRTHVRIQLYSWLRERGSFFTGNTSVFIFQATCLLVRSKRPRWDDVNPSQPCVKQEINELFLKTDSNIRRTNFNRHISLPTRFFMQCTHKISVHILLRMHSLIFCIIH